MKSLLSKPYVRVLYHTAFWVVCFFILFSLFTKDYYNGAIDYAFTWVFLLPLMACVYIGLYGLRRLVGQQKLVLFIVSLASAILVGTIGHTISFNYISDFFFPQYYMSSYFTMWEIAQYVFAFLGVSGMLKLSKDWFLLKNDQLVLEQEHHNVQLAALKSKLNPHFLFNSLNNIYALTEDDPHRSRNYILQLSDALRYMIYETDEEKVPLQNELDYINDYVELEKLRLPESADVKVTVPEASADLIAPLLLLPLVENCFKYVDKHNPKVHISISVNEGVLEANFRNTYAKSIEVERQGGVGLTTLEKRLQLLYPQRHEYINQIDENEYFASLKVDLR